MKIQNVISLALILLLAGSVAFYTLGLDDKVEVKVLSGDDQNIEKEIESALEEAFRDMDEASEDMEEALEEVDQALGEVERTLRDMDIELRGHDLDLKGLIETIRTELKRNKDIEIRREMSREEVEVVRRRVREIARQIIREAFDDGPKLEEKP